MIWGKKVLLSVSVNAHMSFTSCNWNHRNQGLMLSWQEARIMKLITYAEEPICNNFSIKKMRQLKVTELSPSAPSPVFSFAFNMSECWGWCWFFWWFLVTLTIHMTSHLSNPVAIRQKIYFCCCFCKFFFFWSVEFFVSLPARDIPQFRTKPCARNTC